MSDKQAAVICLLDFLKVVRLVFWSGVVRSANGFAIMKKQHLSSFVASQSTLVPCIFMCFRQTFKQALVALLFVFV